MAQIRLFDRGGEQIDELAVDDALLGRQPAPYVVHEVVTSQLANKRRATASTKTRNEMAGGGRKPWRQKRTGRARAGSIRSPIWVGGGVVFGPKPNRNYRRRPPKKARRKALLSALSARATEGQLLALADFEMARPRTKDMVSLLESLGIEGERTLLVLGEQNDNVYLSARNIPNVTTVREWTPEEQAEGAVTNDSTQGVTVYHVVANDWLVFMQSALESLKRRFGVGGTP